MSQAYRSVEITVNGLTYNKQVEPRRLLSDFLREDLDLRGTHVGCEHGICGACTVLMNGHTVRSCLMFAVQANGAEITTIEGLATNGKLHPLQEGFWENHGLQCGFCTPGFLLSACELLERNPDPTEEEVRVGLSGNMCRCTGYQHIVESVLAAAAKMKESSKS
ncbi:MAG: (2Fe-2S)-binding protein [Acidobacteria bacterium]|nr:MAG: (2Fe-2S)-binding protein [Acidobacteriota bacterium]TDI15127.1 MAG: (2Fe-2S)-binding protein [Acidobacteriota bacterium]